MGKPTVKSLQFLFARVTIESKLGNYILKEGTTYRKTTKAFFWLCTVQRQKEGSDSLQHSDFMTRVHIWWPWKFLVEVEVNIMQTLFLKCQHFDVVLMTFSENNNVQQGSAFLLFVVPFGEKHLVFLKPHKA